MRKIFSNRVTRILAITLVVIAGIYAYSYAFQNRTVNEALPTAKQLAATADNPTTPAPSSTETISSGTFRSAPAERAAGTVNLIKVDGIYYVRFEDNTDIGPTPDPIVTFGNNDQADVSINLGSLKGTKGSQNYAVPASVDVSKYDQVIVYCRAFNVPIGFADIK